MKTKYSAWFATLLFGLLAASQSLAVDTTWTGEAYDNDWNTPGNWTDGVPNTPAFNAFFAQAGVNIYSPITIRNLEIRGGFSHFYVENSDLTILQTTTLTTVGFHNMNAYASTSSSTIDLGDFASFSANTLEHIGLHAYSIGSSATIQWAGANIHVIAADAGVYLEGADSSIRNSLDSSDALAGLHTNEGIFSITDRDFTTIGNFISRGFLGVSAYDTASTFTVSGDFLNDGSVSIDSGASLVLDAGSGTMTIAGAGGSIGSLSLGAHSSDIAGTVVAAEIFGGAGSASVNFVHGGTTTFTPRLTGSLGVTKGGNGTTILSGSNSYSGGTIIQEGTLVAANNDAFGTSGVLIQGNDYVRGTLLVESGVSVSNTITFDGGRLIQELVAGTQLAALSEYVGDVSGGIFTIANFAGGQTSASANLQTGFAATSFASNDDIRMSDVFSLSGVPVVDILTGETDTFVLQLQIASVNANTFLGWFDANTNMWVNAADGNFGGTAAFQGDGAYNPGTDFVLGYYGVDTANNAVWAVLNHNSEFSVVPEPSAWALLIFGAGLLLLIGHRQRGLRSS